MILRQITDRIIGSLRVDGIHPKTTTTATSGPDTPWIISNLYGEQWGLFLLLSFLLTWGIGLAPPLLIRFALMRRPIGKGWAIGVIAIFWLFNIALFTALGSQSKSHGALALVAFASYAILTKGAKKQNIPEAAE